MQQCLKPTEGTISISGFDTIQNAQEVRKQIGFMTGQTALYDRLTPTEMVKYISDLHGMDAIDLRKEKMNSLAL